MIEAMQHINGIVYAGYMEDGAIYGETQEGYWRWLAECSEMEHLRRQAERIEQRQQDLRDFRRVLAVRRPLSGQ